MTIYHITNKDKFTGQATITYTSGMLTHIDLSAAQMTADTTKAFKAAVPVLEADIATGFTKGTTIVQGAFEITFTMFWERYPEKRSKARALKLWEKLSKANKVTAWASLIPYAGYLRRRNIFCMHPDTYLRNQEWDTEWNTL